MATLKDVAKLAGVSYNTVSLVVNGIDKVAPATKERVIKAIEKLNYKPNKMARALASGRADAIAFITNRFTSDIAINIFHELEEGIHLAGNLYDYDLLPFSTLGKKEVKNKLLDSIIDGRKADVLIMLNLKPDENQIKKIKTSKTGLILINEESEDAYCINTDNYKGAIIATEYLIKKGKKNIAYIGGPDNTYETGIAFKQRSQGFLDTMKKYNIEINEKIIKYSDSLIINEGYVIMQQIFQDNNKVDAVFCGAGDTIGVGVIKAIKEAGILIPDDIAVIGYGDLSMAEIVTPALTTIKESYEKIGNEAFGAALEMIKTRKRIIKQVIFEPILIIRNTA
jgi:DNA-binding LacI/PurR family transcriptional regulator